MTGFTFTVEHSTTADETIHVALDSLHPEHDDPALVIYEPDDFDTDDPQPFTAPITELKAVAWAADSVELLDQTMRAAMLKTVIHGGEIEDWLAELTQTE